MNDTEKAIIQVGDTVTFGHYHQGNDPSNDTEPIKWLVLDVQDSKALLISRFGLDAKPYNNEEWDDSPWGMSSIHDWLNRMFLNTAFTADELGTILPTDIVSGDNEYYSEVLNPNTQDKIFLLSSTEAKYYFNVEYGLYGCANNNVKSRISPTEYAIAQGAYRDATGKTADGVLAGRWWLRSPTIIYNGAAIVDSDGSLQYECMHITDVCVRPACWIDLMHDGIIKHFKKKRKQHE